MSDPVCSYTVQGVSPCCAEYSYPTTYSYIPRVIPVWFVIFNTVFSFYLPMYHCFLTSFFSHPFLYRKIFFLCNNVYSLLIQGELYWTESEHHQITTCASSLATSQDHQTGKKYIQYTQISIVCLFYE